MSVAVHHGDSREVLKGLGDASIDACVTDPPYALVSITKRFGKDGSAPAKAGKTGAYARASAGFMGQKWDTGETACDPEFWAEVYRVLKPGAHVVAFSGTRTSHRQTCAIEDAGFEIRDQIGWAFGSGFPKSHNQPGGWGTALKPAWEPICLARKPLIGTVAANVLEHGTGALNIDATRIDGRERTDYGLSNATRTKVSTYGKPSASADFDSSKGRWPANLVHDGSDEVVGAFPFTQSNPGQLRADSARSDNVGIAPTRLAGSVLSTGDSGSAARFFYTAKADAEDRMGSKHPTVKPVDLMAWLCRLVTPPGGIILDPFAGTGSTGIAAMREGFDCILIEREAAYVADINRRIAWAKGEGRLTAQEKARAPDKSHDDLPLFGGEAA